MAHDCVRLPNNYRPSSSSQLLTRQTDRAYVQVQPFLPCRTTTAEPRPIPIIQNEFPGQTTVFFEHYCQDRPASDRGDARSAEQMLYLREQILSEPPKYDEPEKIACDRVTHSPSFGVRMRGERESNEKLSALSCGPGEGWKNYR